MGRFLQVAAHGDFGVALDEARAGQIIHDDGFGVNLGVLADDEGVSLNQIAVKLAFENEFPLELHGACDFDVLAEFAAWGGHDG